MNLFKILANGDGTINEPNVSAFLGYLLDPNANHTLGYEFLSRFLENIESLNREDFKCKEFDYQIFFEQAFKEESKVKKEIVDIIIVCYHIPNNKKKESLLKNFIENKKEIVKVFLIENKIRNHKTKKQLENQFKATSDEFKKLNVEDDKIYSIYVTPFFKKEEEGGGFVKEFNENEVGNKTHIFWNKKAANSSIQNILINIINDENKSKIEAVNEYSKHTIKSFIQFIETDFKSEIEIKKDRRTDGVYTSDEKKLNVKSGIEGKLKLLKEELEERLPEDVKVGDPNLSRPKNPELWVFTRNILITINAGYKPRDRVKLCYRVNPEIENSKVSLEQLAKTMGLILNESKSKTMSYCNVDEVTKIIPIENYDEIVKAVEKAIENVDEVLNIKI